MKLIYVRNTKAASNSIVSMYPGCNAPFTRNKKKFVNKHGMRKFHNRILKIGRGRFIRNNVSNQFWENSIKFSFVRDPWDRMVSAWRYCSRSGFISMRLKRSFPLFISRVANHPNTMSVQARIHTDPQYYHFIDNNGNMMLDFIGKIENFNEDTQKLSELGAKPHNLKKKNTTKHAHYKEYYTDELIQLVAKRFKKDIDLFGYTYDRG